MLRQVQRRIRTGRTAQSEAPADPSTTDRDAIQLAISLGRRTEAVRRLRRANRRWRRNPRAWEWVASCASPESVVPVALQLSRQGTYAFAAAILARVDVGSLPPHQQRAVSHALGHGGKHSEAADLLRRLMARQESGATDYPLEMRARDQRRLAIETLHLQANDHIDSLPDTSDVALKGCVVVYNVANPVLTGLMVPLVHPLRQLGYHVAAATCGTLETVPSGVRSFDRLHGIVAPDGRRLRGIARPRLGHEWRIDWEAGVVEADGINYYAYFQERLAQRARRYRVDVLTDQDLKERFSTLLHQSDVALTVCERLLEVATSELPVRIALMDSHFAPYGVIREWCRRVGYQHGIHAVALSVGYENYYSNLTSLEARTLAVEDLTAQPRLRQPFLGGTHRLQAALADDPGLGRDADHEVLSWIRQDRSKVRPASPDRERTCRAVEHTRRRGGKVFVALGKVSIDFAAPGDRGIVHDDFVSWIRHLIRSVRGTENLLLIKPHPHELRQEIVVGGVQLLRELLPPDLPSNVVFLEHDTFNTHELAELVDTAFLWNGTAALEFSVLGVPVAAESVWAHDDYPIGLEVLPSRDVYDRVLRGEDTMTCSPETRRRAAAYLRLMRSTHVAIPYTYLRRPATNMAVGAPALNLEKLAALREAPDPFVERAAHRFFEFSEH